jgi:xanthine/CO dehydrogenase XdhC/CoxF family maturation factor
VTGGISAGCLEDALIRTAWWRTRTDEAVLVKYDSTSDDDELGWGSGFGCNGMVEVLVERQHRASEAALDFIVDTVAREQLGCLMTIFRSSVSHVPTGSRASLTARGDIAFCGGAEWRELIGAEQLAAAEKAMKIGQGRTLVLTSRHGQIDVLVEPVVPPPRLFICGEGPDAAPLARLARDLGWSVVIWASGPRWLSRERFHGLGELSTGTAYELRAAVDASARPAAVILSHRYDRDRELLDGLLGSKTDYIGILGPRARTLRLLADLGQHAPSPVTSRRIHAPIGLDIGAETPQEIGLSVMAEIQAVLSGSTAKPLSQCRGRIHSRRIVSLEPSVNVE